MKTKVSETGTPEQENLSLPALDKFEAGRLLQQRREEKGLTQEEVVAMTSIGKAAYLSGLENGRINAARSKHFGSLAAALELSDDDILAIAPAALVRSETLEYTIYDNQLPSTLAARDRYELVLEAERLTATEEPTISQVGPSHFRVQGRLGHRTVTVNVLFPLFPSVPAAVHGLPAGLSEAVERYGDAAPALRTPEWQQYLAGLQALTSTEHSADDWYDLYLTLQRFGVQPPAAMQQGEKD